MYNLKVGLVYTGAHMYTEAGFVLFLFIQDLKSSFLNILLM